MNNSPFITAKLGWFTSKIEMDVSYESDNSIISKMECYEGGSIKACIAKFFGWVDEAHTAIVGGRKIYIDKDKFNVWKHENVVRYDLSLSFETVDEWVAACKAQNINKLSVSRFQELLNEGSVSQEICGKIEFAKLSTVTLDSIPLDQIEKLCKGKSLWALGLRENFGVLKSLVEKNKISNTLFSFVKARLLQENTINWADVSSEQIAIFSQDEDFINAKLKKLVESGKISAQLYPDVKAKLLEQQHIINWANVSSEQIAIFCGDGDFLNAITPNVLHILLNNQKLRSEDLNLIEGQQFQRIDFSILRDHEMLTNLLFTDEANSRARYLKQERFNLLSTDQIVNVCKHYWSRFHTIEASLFITVAYGIKQETLQSLELSQLPEKLAEKLCEYRFKDFTLQQVQYCVKKNWFSYEQIKDLDTDFLHEIDFTQSCSSSFYIRINDVKINQLNDLLTHHRCDKVLGYDKYLRFIDDVKKLSPQAIAAQRQFWLSSQIGSFTKEQVEYLMECNVIQWQMLRDLKPEIFKEVNRETLQSWLNAKLHTAPIIVDGFEEKNKDKCNRELLNEKQLEVVKSLDLNI